MSSTSIYNFEVSQNNYNSVVLMNSYKIPVFTLFMSPSIGSCIDLERTLSEYAIEFKGQFILARIDVDMEPELRDENKIINVPTLKIFKDGEMKHQEVGMLTAEEIADVFNTHGIFRASDQIREQARQQHIMGNTQQAIDLLTRAIQSDPSNPRVVMDMIQIMLDIKLLDQAKDLFNRLPEKERASDTGKAIIGQMTFQGLAANTHGLESLLQTVESTPDDCDARFDLALCYVAEHAYEDAMSQIFEILDVQPTYKEGAAQELAVSIINMLEPNNKQLAQDSRRILSNMLSQ